MRDLTYVFKSFIAVVSIISCILTFLGLWGKGIACYRIAIYGFLSILFFLIFSILVFGIDNNYILNCIFLVSFISCAIFYLLNISVPGMSGFILIKYYLYKKFSMSKHKTLYPSLLSHNIASNASHIEYQLKYGVRYEELFAPNKENKKDEWEECLLIPYMFSSVIEKDWGNIYNYIYGESFYTAQNRYCAEYVFNNKNAMLEFAIIAFAYILHVIKTRYSEEQALRLCHWIVITIYIDNNFGIYVNNEINEYLRYLEEANNYMNNNPTVEYDPFDIIAKCFLERTLDLKIENKYEHCINLIDNTKYVLKRYYQMANLEVNIEGDNNKNEQLLIKHKKQHLAIDAFDTHHLRNTFGNWCFSMDTMFNLMKNDIKKIRLREKPC